MKIDIWDIDGTLTLAHGDMKDTSGFHTYAFWPLITERFTKDLAELRKMIATWDESMKTEKDPTQSSHDMLQRGIETFRDSISHLEIYHFAKETTLKFIQHGIVRKEAITYLEDRINQGITCILSTGSYQDGATGFADALVESGFLSLKARNQLLISGAVIDWKNKKVLHANIRDRKLIGLEKVLGMKLQDIKPHIQAVYADDPWINDRDILSIAPRDAAYVIATSKNRDKELPEGYALTTWPAIIKR